MHQTDRYTDGMRNHYELVIYQPSICQALLRGLTLSFSRQTNVLGGSDSLKKHPPIVLQQRSLR